MVLSIYPDEKLTNPGEIQTGIERCLRMLDSTIDFRNIDVDSILQTNFQNKQNSGKIFELVNILPRNRKIVNILYVLDSLSDSPYKKKSKNVDHQTQPIFLGANEKIVSYTNSSSSFILNELKKFMLYNNPNENYEFFNISSAGVLLPKPNIHIPSSLEKISTLANTFVFFHKNIVTFLDTFSSSGYANFFKEFIRFNPKIEKFRQFDASSPVCFLVFLESIILDLETINYVIHDFNYSYCDEMIMNCFLKNYYNPRSHITKRLYFSILKQLNPVFKDQIMNFIFRDQEFKYYRVGKKSTKSIFNEIDIIEENLPFRLIDVQTITKIANIKQLTNILKNDFNLNLPNLQEMINPEFMIYDENSVLVFKQEIEKIHLFLQTKLFEHLIFSANLADNLEVYKIICLNFDASFLVDLISEYKKLSSIQHNKMYLERAFEFAFRRLPPRYRKYEWFFEVIFYSQLGEAEPISTNFFLKFNFSEIPRVVVTNHFQENNLRLFNLLLKLREFSIDWQDFFWNNKKSKTRYFHILFYMIHNFFKSLFYYIYQQVIEVLHADLLVKIKNSRHADEILVNLNDFSDNVNDFCFLNYTSAGQRTVYQLIDALISRLGGFMLISIISLPKCLKELKAFRRMCKLLLAKLIDLEAIRPKGVYVKLRFLLEFNNFNFNN